MPYETVLKDITGQSSDIVATPTQALADQGFVPIGGDTSKINTTTTPPTATPTNTTLSDVRSALDQEMASLRTPEDIEKAKQAGMESTRSTANTIFDEQIRRAYATGEKRLGSATGQLGVTRGLGFSTAQASYLNGIQNETEAAVKEIESKKADYIRSGNMEYARLADEQLNKLSELRIGILTQKANLAISERSEARAEEQLGLNRLTTKFNIMKDLEKGNTITVDGQTFTGTKVSEVDPFFKGSDIVSLMKEIPEGEERTITDPNTGGEITFYGVSKTEPDTQRVESYNDKGELIVTTYKMDESGKMQFSDQQNFGKVGKTKAAGTSVTLQTRNEVGGLVSTISDIFTKDQGTDNKISPDTYKAQENTYIRTGLGDTSDFRRLFPPDEYLTKDSQLFLGIQTPKEDELGNLTDEFLGIK